MAIEQRASVRSSRQPPIDARSSSTGEPWRVGVLFSNSGVTGSIEGTQLKGTILAIDEINAGGGINGRELVPIIYDPASEPVLYAHFARKLLIEDRVTSIFGCYTTLSRKAVLPIVERTNALLWYPTFYEGFECSPNIIYTGAAPNQNTFELIDYLFSVHATRFYLVGTDYRFPRETNRIVRNLVRERGGQIVGERYFDFNPGPLDFKQTIRAFRETSPDVIFSTLVGEAIPQLYRAYADAGFNPAVMPIASLTTSEVELRLMGGDVASGHLTAASYFEGIANAQNERFVRLFKKRFGAEEPTNMCAEAAYYQTHLFAKALSETNTLDADVLRPAVHGCEIDAPQGHIGVDYENNHTELWTRIGKADGSCHFRIMRESRLAVKADPYLLSGCAL